MKNIKYVDEHLKDYLDNKEYIANTHVMHCLFISMVLYTGCVVLNLINIFNIDTKIMMMGYIPSILIYLVLYILYKKSSVSSYRTKYFIMFGVVLAFTCVEVSVTYHAVTLAILPLLYAVLYSSKKIMWYTYGLTVLSTIATVFIGYKYGLCDANMVLLTSTSLRNYIQDGMFTLNTINNNPVMTLTLYWVVPRCLVYIAFVAICNNIYTFVHAGIRQAEKAMQLAEFQEELSRKVQEQNDEIREQQLKLKEAYLQTVVALSEAVDAKDRYTSGHSHRVAKYAKMLAQRMGKSEEEQEIIYRAGLLHDVGKIRIPNEIINKTVKLTDDEYDLIKVHPVSGYHILKEISAHSEIDLAAKYHHERYDGNGYPNGLKGEVIPEIARILAVADSYDAMTSNRSYRKGMTQYVVRSEIEKGKGTQFDPAIADIMLTLIDEDTDYQLRQHDKDEYKILVMSEDADTGSRIEDIIEDENIYNIITVNSGEDAVEKLKDQQVELVIVDIVSDDEDTSGMIKSIKNVYNIPIVILSDDKDLRNTINFTDYNCDDYITKPFRPLVIKEIIYNMTKKTVID